MQTTWQSYYDASIHLASQWEIGPATRVVIPPLSLWDGLVAMGAALHLGCEILFDEKGSVSPSETDFVAPRPFEARNESFTLSGDIPPEILASCRKASWGFASSGSTAQPKIIAKSSEGLLAEVDQLSRLYSLEAGDAIVCLVRPFHIYGFLHGFLLPLVTRAQISFWNTGYSLPSPEEGFPNQPKLLVTVPAHFNLLSTIWSFTRTPQLVSSGAPFGQQRLQKLNHRRTMFDHYFEILGSTETGGMGYRRLGVETAFTAFEGVRLVMRDEQTLIYSPFLIPETHILSSDMFEDLGPGLFLHLGRSDKVFKYGGLRYSLGEIEEILSGLCEGAEVICHFEADESSAQGGILRAWIESEVMPLHLRRDYGAKGQRPWPQALHFVPKFPRDAQGKVSLTALKAETKSRP